MWDDVAVDQVPLLGIVDDDFVELHMFCEEQITIPESTTTGWFCRQHVLSVASALDSEYAHTVVSSAHKVAEFVNLLLAFLVFR